MQSHDSLLLADRKHRLGSAMTAPQNSDATYFPLAGRANGRLCSRASLPLETLLLGNTHVMRRLRDQIARLAPMDFAVIIHGPTGAGKELVATALHQLSKRRGDLVAVNTSAIADSMFEDAMFGHARGAFTGAIGELRGHMAEANGGTLFLDEVSTIGRSVQAKLLRALETKTFRPVGAFRDCHSDFRVVSATNLDLEHLIERHAFREDLAERLSAATIDVPALADRREDIPQLVTSFAAAATAGSGRVVRFAPDAMDLLQHHPWPRNVRQLRHAVERAIALHDRPILDAAAVAAALWRPSQRKPAGQQATIERTGLCALLDASGWDTARVATALGVNRATVYRRMRRFGIPVPTRDAAATSGVDS